MGVPLKDMIARLPEDEQAAIRARGAALIAEEMSLRQLRTAIGKTQVTMARELGIKQENVSRIEQRHDMLVSTLNGYLKRVGGRLRLIVEFDDRPPVEITGLSALTAPEAVEGRRAPTDTRSSASRNAPAKPLGGKVARVRQASRNTKRPARKADQRSGRERHPET